MPLLDAQQNPAPTTEEQAAAAANRIRRIVRRMHNQVGGSVQEIKRLVDRHGRAAIARALGADADELQTLYVQAKNFAEQHPDVTLEDLPS